MKILLVTDQYYDANNGLTISSRRFAGILREHGHEVRVASVESREHNRHEQNSYLMKKQYIPVFDKLVSSQGMTFAKPNDMLLKDAIEWADVVHIVSPFILSHHAIKLARQNGTPYTGAFHVQPENITASIHLRNASVVNTCIYKWFHFYIFKYCNHIHCPSSFIAGEMRRHGYIEQLHVISNGIDPDFRYAKLPKTDEYKDSVVVLMIGRMSIEKRQDVLIKAVSRSKYADKIKLVLAGKGPRTEKLLKLAKKLSVNIQIKFFTKKDLISLISMSDLYVHAADMEIEAMSCMEAFAGGLVPVIANSSRSATPQFALDERSLFNAGDSDDLARKIDYWLEHPSERETAEREYAKLAKKYMLDDCVRMAEDMFLQAISECEGVTEDAV